MKSRSPSINRFRHVSRRVCVVFGKHLGTSTYKCIHHPGAFRPPFAFCATTKAKQFIEKQRKAIKLKAKN